MELVKSDGEHKQNHKGSVHQFEQKYKVKYNTKKSLRVALKKGWVSGRIPKWWRDLISKNKSKCT